MERLPFEPVPLVRKDASGQIAHQLRKAISTGIWSPGEKLPTEMELAETFEVSRATAREALKLLSATGLVHSTRGGQGGTFVTLPEAEKVATQLSEAIQLWYRTGNVTVHNVDEARHVLESICVELAARRRTLEDITAIQHAIDSAQAEGMHMDEWLQWDLAFHTAISKATKNPILELSMMSVHQSRPATNTVFVGLLDRVTVLRQHQQIADAIRSKEPTAARDALLSHVNYLDEVRRSALTALEVDDVPVSQLLP